MGNRSRIDARIRQLAKDWTRNDRRNVNYEREQSFNNTRGLYSIFPWIETIIIVSGAISWKRGRNALYFHITINNQPPPTTRLRYPVLLNRF